MDFSDSRLSRSLFLVLVVVTAAVVVWFVLKFLLKFVPALALPLLLLTAIFLIVLVLIQRGKGGGLAGAFGGMGGQSAFGTKAGDLFTRVTIGVALFWIILCTVTVSVLGTVQGPLDKDMGGGDSARQEAPSTSSDEGPGSGSGQTPGERKDSSGSQDND